MVSEDLKTIVDKLNEQGKMTFLEGASEEQIEQFEKDHKITFPTKYKEWLLYSDGGDFFFCQQEFSFMAYKPLINSRE